MFKVVLSALLLIIQVLNPNNLLAQSGETRMSGSINYYGIDRSYKTVEYGTVSVDKAIKVVEERFARLKPRYETAEEAIAETMFGFNRTTDAFIEITINAPTQISFKLEIPRSKRFLIFQNVYQKETVLKSKEELLQQVKAFFSMDIEAYREFLEKSRG
jgi:hypothetical protein